MERLTKRLDDGQAVMDCKSCELCAKNCVALACRNRLKDRLAAYEDTGLEPESVSALKLASMGKAIAEINAFDGISIDRLRGLVAAEQKRRDGCEFCRAVYTKEDWASGGAHDFRLHDGTLSYYDEQFGWEGMKVNKCPHMWP